MATPIGNLSDLTGRTGKVLKAADHLLAEDTRRARILLQHTGSSVRPVSLHAHNEASRVARVLRWLARGDDVALVSDAGTPLLSDPGARVVRASIDGGHDVVPVPGPSAVLAGLVASGLPCVPFTFVGFLPRSAVKREHALKQIVGAKETTVLFESPVRLVSLLEALAALTSPGRRLAVCREMTKRHEEIFRGTPTEAARHFRETPPRGEVTLVVEGCPVGEGISTDEEVEELATRFLAQGMAPTGAARNLAARTGLSRQAAYDAVLEAKRRRRSTGKPVGREKSEGDEGPNPIRENDRP